MLDEQGIMRMKYLGINISWREKTSNELVEIMKDKSVWDEYQELRNQFNIGKKEYRISQGKDCRLTYEVINDQLGDFDGIIADLGCGGNELAKLRPQNKVYGFDFYAMDDTIIPCSITDVPLDDESVDVVVISLALSTSDYHLVLYEASRILKKGGLLKLVLVTFSKILGDVVRKYLPNMGFSEAEMITIDNLVYIDSVKN